LVSTVTVTPQLSSGSGRIFDQSIGVVAVGLAFSRKHKSLLPTKLNHVRLESKLDETFGPAFAPGAVSARHEMTKGQWLSVGMSFHGHSTAS
jgi:hypothetical protein